MVRKEKIWLPIEDDVWGIEGSFYDKKEVEGMDDEEKLYYIEYVPDQDPNRGFITWLRTVLPVLDPPVSTTPQPIPDSMFDRVTCQDAGNVPGVPNQKLHIREDKNSNSGHRNKLGNYERNQLRRQKQRQKSSEAGELEAEAEKVASEQEQEVEDDRNSRRRDEGVEDYDWRGGEPR